MDRILKVGGSVAMEKQLENGKGMGKMMIGDNVVIFA